MKRQLIELKGNVSSTDVVRDIVLSGIYDEIVIKSDDGKEISFKKNSVSSILHALNR